MNFFQKLNIKDKITLLYKYLQHLGHCLQNKVLWNHKLLFHQPVLKTKMCLKSI